VRRQESGFEEGLGTGSRGSAWWCGAALGSQGSLKDWEKGVGRAWVVRRARWESGFEKGTGKRESGRRLVVRCGAGESGFAKGLGKGSGAGLGGAARRL
jgi:hypothetical protein